ncbi:histidine phosphatase family protein [Candidatus Pacearchaeota archaeon]|nr:histidine phosphatase family protein [Candidatus Pacearchaeota archaeon]
MKHLVVARHGDYISYSNPRISLSGHHQMEELGRAIKEIFNGKSAHLVSSTAPRALDCSEVLAVQLALHLEFDKIPYLWSEHDGPPDCYYFQPSLVKVMALVDERREKAEGLIMMTHLGLLRDFLSYFLNKEFGRKEEIGELNKGQAVHFDLEKRAYQILPRA